MNNYLQQNQGQQLVSGGASFSPYMNPSWTPMNRLPTYSASPLHGENAAWQFPMGPNSEIYLPDADEDIIWWIRTDQNGNRNVVGFDITLHQKPTPVDINDVMTRLAALEDKVNAKLNKSNAKRNATVDTAAVE